MNRAIKKLAWFFCLIALCLAGCRTAHPRKAVTELPALAPGPSLPPLPPQPLSFLLPRSESAAIVIPPRPTGFVITGIEVYGSSVIISWDSSAAEEVAIQRTDTLGGVWQTIGAVSISPFVSDKVGGQAFYRLLKPPSSDPEFIYAEDFLSRTKPAEWDEWNSLQYHQATWAYPNPIAGMPSVAFGAEPLAIGAFCSFGRGSTFNDLWVGFLFRFESASSQILEVCDLYDTNQQEVCDVYLYPDGLLFLLAMGRSAWCEEPIQVGRDAKLLIHYWTDGNSATRAEFWWAYVDEPFQNTPLRSCATDGEYRTPIVRFLWGPVHHGGVYTYGQVRVSTIAPFELR